MNGKFGNLCAATIAACLTCGEVAAQAPQSYVDYRKQEVVLPLGPLSFADRAVSHAKGSKQALKPERNPANALGEPDFKKAGDGRAFTLGCHGEAVFEFVDNALVDVDGPDLYIFEVGQDVEPTFVSLSRDGENWRPIGKIAGAKTAIDLRAHGLSDETFRFVRLKDTGKYCSGRWPGADIDAIAAVGSAIRFELASNVLFDFDKSDLKPGAASALDALLDKLKTVSAQSIRIGGHTDSKGSDTYNQSLSERRAESVVRVLRERRPGFSGVLSAVGYGETEPVADNSTDEGRARNRRVEVIVVPAS